MNFGTRLKQLRTKKKLTQAGLGKILALRESTISCYESNKRKPDLDIIKKIAEFFNVTTDYLLGRTDQPNVLSVDNFKDYLSPDEYEFVAQQKNVPWIELATEFAGQGLSPAKVRELIQLAMKLSEK